MIHTEALTRTFRVRRETVEAVKGIDIDVREGELVAFLGPNGAGKSTTLRMLTTLLQPTAGTARVAGWDVRANPAAVRERIGYIGQGNGAGHGHRVRDELVNQGRCYRLSRADSRARADELLTGLDLGGLAGRTAGSLSGGQRRRLDVAMGLMHRPRLLFLDEPSTGLDPQNRANLWDHVLRMRREFGTTLLVTTHYLEEADTMAERVVIIDHGKVIADGTAEQLKSDHAGDLITLTTPDEQEAARCAEIADRAADEVEVESTAVRLRVRLGEQFLPGFLRSVDAAGIKVLTAGLKRPTLDDVFLNLTGRTLRESDQ